MKPLFCAVVLLELFGRGTAQAVETPGRNALKVEANKVAEITFEAIKPHPDPFMRVVLDVEFTDPAGAKALVPGFWAGQNQWKVRYASPRVGVHAWRSVCSDSDDTGLHSVTGQVEITPNTGTNPLYVHGPVRVAKDGRHFAHADGTPFFWLGDTWWKGLCQRLTKDGFQELAKDRVAKGFTVVQIVCGPYPDESFLDERIVNEGGKPYESQDFTRVNPQYFDYADRRFQHMIDAGLSPAIVGAWGRSDCNSLQVIGVEGLKRHWRYLVARYAAYPVFWILAGEIPDQTKWGQGQWGEVGKYLRTIDPYHRLVTCHTTHGRRGADGDVNVIDYDMVGGDHDQNGAIGPKSVGFVTAACSKNPPLPVLVGETCYEGHMQQGFGDIQRRIFWQSILSGAAGHTYGAAGIWHAGVEGDPGHTGAWGQEYDFTTWKEGMNYPGSAQLGRAKKLLEQYPWWRFEPHPEWAPGCYAAGIPDEVRFVYLPRRNIYNWSGPEVKDLGIDVDWHVYYWDPASGRKFDQGTIKGVANFKKNVPSPQDWVLVLECVKPALKVQTTPPPSGSDPGK